MNQAELSNLYALSYLILITAFITERKLRHEEIKLATSTWRKGHNWNSKPDYLACFWNWTQPFQSPTSLSASGCIKPSVIWPLPTGLSHLPPTVSSSRTELPLVLRTDLDFSPPRGPRRCNLFCFVHTPCPSPTKVLLTCQRMVMVIHRTSTERFPLSLFSHL